MNWKMKHNDAWLSFISVHCLNYCINQTMFSHSYFFCQLLVCLKQTLCYWWGNSLTYQIFINHSTLLEMTQTQSGASYWGLVPKPRQAYGWYSNQKPSDSSKPTISTCHTPLIALSFYQLFDCHKANSQPLTKKQPYSPNINQYALSCLNWMQLEPL